MNGGTLSLLTFAWYNFFAQEKGLEQTLYEKQICRCPLPGDFMLLAGGRFLGRESFGSLRDGDPVEVLERSGPRYDVIRGQDRLGNLVVVAGRRLSPTDVGE